MRPLLEVNNLEKSYNKQVVLDHVSFVISEGAHIGLSGRNGAGKTTLLKVLAGDTEPDAGTIKLMPWTRLGVLRQHELLPSDMTTLAYFSSGSGRPEWECAKLASRFGMQKKDLEKIPTTLSGGYQMRVKLVRMLLDQPNLLLLDEPMNYLDLPTILLLEAFLKDYSGSFIMTSHDREAMQSICTSTFEVEGGKLVEFPGDLETYLDWKEEQVEYAKRTNKRLRREIAHTQEFVDRFRYKASLATRAQSKLHHIAKLRSQLHQIGRALPTTAFKIPCPPVVPGPAVRCEDLAIGYGEKVIVGGINYEVPRGAKVAIVGENGHGKSTFLKTLAGTTPVLGGKMKWWHRADIGYFSQMSEDSLVPNETVLEALMRGAGTETPAERVLAAAGAFLFRNDDLEKTCNVLSGGERARVRLAQLVLQQHNVLILDEPTNHLDVETVEVLARALKEYAGTIFIVSHARSFMNAIIDEIFEIHNGIGHRYIGTYEEYVADLVALSEQTTHGDPETKEAHAEESSNRHLRATERRAILRNQQKLLERQKKLDAEKSEILGYYFDNPTDYAPAKATRLAEIDEELTQIEKEWFALEASLVG